MRLSVPALRRARPEMFVNYIRGAFIAPEPRVTKKPPPPPNPKLRAVLWAHPSPVGLAEMAAPARRSQALGAAVRKLEKGTRSASRGVTRSPRGPGKNWSPGGPRCCPAWTLMIPDREPSVPILTHSCPPAPPPEPQPWAVSPGKGEAEDSRGWPLGGQSGLHSLGWATRDRGGDPEGWGRGTIGERAQSSPPGEKEGGVGCSARLSPDLSLRRAPYLLLQSCTLFPPAVALGAS